MIKVPKTQVIPTLEAGSYVARCYSMIHIGTTEFEWQGEMKKTNKVRITFEIPSELRSFKEGQDLKPVAVSKELTLSLHEKSKMRPLLEAWRGKKFNDEEIDNFDVTNLVGAPALITVIISDKGYLEIANIAKLPKGMECPPQVNKSQILDYDTFDQEIFNSLPEFLRNKIVSSEEYKMKFGKLDGEEARFVEDLRKGAGEEEQSLEEVPFF